MIFQILYTSFGVIALIVIISWGACNYVSTDPVYFLNKAQTLQEDLDSGALSKYEISSAQMNIRAYKDIYEKNIKKKENFKTAQKILFFVDFLQQKRMQINAFFF